MRGEIDDILFEIAERKGLKLPMDDTIRSLIFASEVAIAMKPEPAEHFN